MTQSSEQTNRQRGHPPPPAYDDGTKLALFRRKVFSEVVLIAGAILVLAMLYHFDPVKGGLYPVCWFHRITGWNCPGCGGLRALHQLLHGHVMEAIQFNVMVVIAIPICLYNLVRYWFGKRLGVPFPARVSSSRRWIVLVVVMMLFGVLRNLPFPMFDWMSP